MAVKTATATTRLTHGNRIAEEDTAEAKIAGNTTFAAMLIGVLDASNVEIVTPVVAADTAAAFLSPANWQTT